MFSETVHQDSIIIVGSLAPFNLYTLNWSDSFAALEYNKPRV